MKKFTKTLMASALLSTALLSHSVSAEQKVAFVDMQGVLQSLPQVATISENINTEFKDRIQNVNKLQEDGEFLVQKLQREAATMSDAEKKKLEEQIISIRDELQQKARPLQQEMQGRSTEERNKLMVLIQGAVDAIAKKEKLDMVVEKQALIFSKPEYDISQQVLEQVSKAK